MQIKETNNQIEILENNSRRSDLKPTLVYIDPNNKYITTNITNAFQVIKDGDNILKITSRKRIHCFEKKVKNRKPEDPVPFFYVTTIPKAFKDYLNTDYLYFYEENNQIISSTEQPPNNHYKKLKIGAQMSLPRNYFRDVRKGDVVALTLDFTKTDINTGKKGVLCINFEK